jgi:protease IV
MGAVASYILAAEPTRRHCFQEDFSMSPLPNSPNQPGGNAPPPQSPYEPPRRDFPTRVILEPSGGRFGRWSGRLGWLLFIVALIYIAGTYGSYSSYMQTNPRLEERYFSNSRTATDKVAIIAIEGVIMGEDGFAKWQIDQARNDPNVKAVVVRVDSPGGTITGSNYLYHQLSALAKEKKIKLVVSMGSVAASGGYYVSMAVGNTPDTIYAEPATWTGSIGVVIPHYDVSELLEKWSITDDSIVSNPLKLTGSMTRKLSPELAKQEHDILQNLVDESFGDFKDIVKSGRPEFEKNPKELDDIATGQVYTAKQAQKNHLVDKLGYIEDAVQRAIELNELKAENVRVVKYDAPKSLLNLLGGATASSDLASLSHGSHLDLSALLDLTAPRAYYLCTWLPAVARHGGL